MKAGVPSHWLVAVRPLVNSSAPEMPKSITRGPVSLSRTLPGFRSRWTIPVPWMAVSAVSTPTASASRAEPVSGPRSVTTFSRSGPAMYSVTM
jgi:hypothetical protein